MQQIAKFMHELISARIAEEKGILERRAMYRERFFHPDCFWDNRKGTLEMIETERIVGTEVSGSKAMVITEYNVPVYNAGGGLDRLRYHLVKTHESWHICFVEQRCPRCQGKGDECLRCNGKHWLGMP